MSLPAGLREPGGDHHLTFLAWVAGIILRWRMVLATLGVAILGAIVALLVLPPVYRVQVSFVTGGSAAGKLSGALGGSGLMGLASQLGVSPGGEPGESPLFYSELLGSRELLTRLLESRFPDPRTANPSDSARLVDILRLRSSDPARRMELGVKLLTRSITAESDVKTNLTKVEVDAEWPALSAQIANRALALVNNFNLEQRASRARQKRVYTEGRLALAKQDLAVAEVRHRQFLDQNRQWRASPMLSSDEQQLQRQVDIASDLYMSLQKQYETARLEEFNDAAVVTVVDSAVPPRKPAWPRYGLLSVATILIGLILGAMIAGIATVFADWSRRNGAAAHGFASAGSQAWDEVTAAARRGKPRGDRAAQRA